jgi:hypothetical protein
MKFKMAATAGLSLTLDPMWKMFQNASSLKPLRQLKPIFIVSEKKAFEHFSIGFNVNLCPAVAAILNFRSALKKKNFVEDLPMIIPGQFGFNCPRMPSSQKLQILLKPNCT